MVVDAEVDQPVVPAAVAPALAHDEQSRRLLTATVPACRLGCPQALDQPRRKRRALRGGERVYERLDGRRRLEQVALRGEALAGDCTRKGRARRPGEGRAAAVASDDAELSLLPARILAR